MLQVAAAFQRQQAARQQKDEALLLELLQAW